MVELSPTLSLEQSLATGNDVEVTYLKFSSKVDLRDCVHTLEQISVDVKKVPTLLKLQMHPVFTYRTGTLMHDLDVTFTALDMYFTTYMREECKAMFYGQRPRST